ncbi:MAG: MFS transporter, partial [Geminicoccales bacterium]
MAIHVRHPMWLEAVARPGVGAFALLFAIESFARAILVTVIPLQAFTVLQSSRAVSLLFTCVGIAGLVGSLFIPFLIRLIPRRWVYTLGALGLVLAAALFALDGVQGLLAGLVFRVLAVACLNVTLNLYIMDTIRRGDLVRSEPFRLAVSGVAWTLCPSLGVLLYDRFGAIAADGLSAAAAVLLLAAFWTIRLSDNPAIAAPRRPAPDRLPNPLQSIGRFLAQPRLRLGWLIAFGRSSWWAQFFTFTPLYLVISGHSELTSALVISLANAMLFLTVLIGRFAERVGVRLVIVAAYLLTGATMLAAALLATIGWSLAVA